MGQQAQRTAGARRGGRRPVADRDQRGYGVRARVLRDSLRPGFGILKAQRESAVLPRILQNMAAVGSKNHRQPELFRCLHESLRLVPGRGA
jgi:hypothetical protein